jgi:hypothetical protein
MSEYEELLLEAYHGELLGDALFGAMADAEDDDAQREKLRALQQVEARTASRLRVLVEKAGIDAGDEQAPRADGVRMAEGVGDQPWLAFLESLRSALPSYLANFEQLQSIGERDDPILVELVAHEQAIDRFAELEGEGRSVEALAVLSAHLDASHATR